MDGVTCAVCGAGNYSDTSNATMCKKCIAGSYLIDADRSDSSKHDSTEDCLVCEAGRYKLATMLGAEECLSCAAGTELPPISSAVDVGTTEGACSSLDSTSCGTSSDCEIKDGSCVNTFGRRLYHYVRRQLYGQIDGNSCNGDSQCAAHCRNGKCCGQGFISCPSSSASSSCSSASSSCVCNGKTNSRGDGGSDCESIYTGSNYPNDKGKAFCYVDKGKCSGAHSSQLITGSEWSVTPCQSNSLSSSSSKKSDGSSCSYNSDCSSGTCSSSDSESSCDITADCNKDELEKMMECMEDIDLDALTDDVSTNEEMCATMVEALQCYASCICRKACFQDQIKLTKETCDTNACSSLGAGDSKSFDGLVLILILLVHLTFG